jgi:hypothetical protein
MHRRFSSPIIATTKIEHRLSPQPVLRFPVIVMLVVMRGITAGTDELLDAAEPAPHSGNFGLRTMDGAD